MQNSLWYLSLFAIQTNVLQTYDVPSLLFNSAINNLSYCWMLLIAYAAFKLFKALVKVDHLFKLLKTLVKVDAISSLFSY